MIESNPGPYFIKYLIRLKFNPNIFAKLHIFQTNLSEMLKAEYKIYLCMYKNFSCIC